MGGTGRVSEANVGTGHAVLYREGLSWPQTQFPWSKRQTGSAVVIYWVFIAFSALCQDLILSRLILTMALRSRYFHYVSILHMRRGRLGKILDFSKATLPISGRAEI